MIVKMKKLTLLVSSKYREAALNRLRALSVVHVHAVASPASEDITVLENKIAEVNKVLQIIGEGGGAERGSMTGSAAELAEEILTLVKKRAAHIEELEELTMQHRWFENWGSLSLETVQKLMEAGVIIRFYIGEKKRLEELPEGATIHIVKEEGAAVYFAYFAGSVDDRLDYKEDQMPPIEFALLKDHIAAVESDIIAIERKLTTFSTHRQLITEYKKDLEKQLEFNKVKFSMGDEKGILYLQGFCPVDSVERVKEAADEEGWAYILQDPDDPFEVPTLLRNPRWLRMINPLFKFMSTLPGYAEHDVSFWFLLFFSIFFALIIGDAGYGIIFLLLTVFASRKARSAPREPFRLLYVLSTVTIIWGLISGNWFGYEKIGQLPFLNRMIIDKIDAFATDNQVFMMYLCFLIGVVHLTIARAITVVRYINSPTAIAEIGWIIVLWCVFFMAGNLVLNRAMPGFVVYAFVIGSGMILLFANFQRNIFKGMLLTLSTLPLSIIGSFSDVVSYLRLFAVGYATVIVAVTFNGMAIKAGFDSILTGLIAASILCIGHLLNIALGLMAVVVHGIRLNMLEFSGHLNMQWSGKPYLPFKE